VLAPDGTLWVALEAGSLAHLTPGRGCARRETLAAENVRFIRGSDRISQPTQRPDLAEGVAQVRRDMEDADRTYDGPVRRLVA
jgi:hypothetical protein